MKLKDKVAVVTGASSGIGKAIARKLSSEGCKIALASRSVDKLQELSNEFETKTIAVRMDVTETESVKGAFEDIFRDLGQVDILVNCAGVMPLTYLKNRHLDEWLDTIEVNVKGTLRCIHEALPPMKVRKSGHIVNIASVDGKEIFAGGAIYGASKAAIIELSRAMRMELSPNFNIRVTSIEPGTVATNLRDDITDTELLKEKDYSYENEAHLEPEDIANAVFYAVKQPDSVNVNELLIKPTGKA